MAGSAVRARWTLRLDGSPLLNTAFALEAMLDEVVFIIGPVLVTFLATAFHPALGISVSAIIGFIGAVALAVQRSTQPQIRRDAARWPCGIISAAVACPGPRRHRVCCPRHGVWGHGGQCRRLCEGGWCRSVCRRDLDVMGIRIVGSWCHSWGDHLAGVGRQALQVGASLLAVSLLPLPFVGHHPVALALLLMLSGMAIAPTLIASVAVTQSSVDQTRLTEALAWTSTGMAAGVAVGAAAVGHVIDSSGAAAGFVAVVMAGLLLTAQRALRS